MELFSTPLYFIIVDGLLSLWINRHNSYCESKTGHSYSSIRQIGAVYLGSVYGFIGKLILGSQSETHLVFIRQCKKVGNLRGCDIYKISSVVTIELESDAEVFLEQSTYSSNDLNEKESSSENHNDIIPRNLNKVRPVPVAAKSHVDKNLHSSPSKQDRRSKIERRLLEEFQKMFTEAESFYFSKSYDLTNTIQRQSLFSENEKTFLPLYQKADKRFFWNFFLMADLIDQNQKDSSLSYWIVPIIQGFIQVENCTITNIFNSPGYQSEELSSEMKIWLISRRSRFRAGTRYLRRGVDELGKVANYVETEQIIDNKNHYLAFVMTRGSIPLFWSQPGYKYRPPPQLDKGPEEQQAAFKKHFDEELSIYGPITSINLLDKTGKEKLLGDAFMLNILKQNAPEISYFTFDFHDQCRGMHFENVNFLLEKLDKKLKDISYTWVDEIGFIQKQIGAIRVNCVDCLDRTNVVQTFIAKNVLYTKMSKLGLLSPEFGLPESVKKSFQSMWANNGDVISKQYAGTSALKSDFTRTGERRFAGALKDGMNSANRYYLNRFRDANRQAIIDIQLGVRKNVSEDELDEQTRIVEDRENTAEQIKNFIDDIKKFIIPRNEAILGSWGLVNSKENDLSIMDTDTILILTESYYYVTRYDDTVEASITGTEKVDLIKITSIEVGFEILNESQDQFSLTGKNSKIPTRVPSLRLNFLNESQILSFHQFRSSNTRFFNNVTVPIKHLGEMMDALKVIAESIKMASTCRGSFAEVNFNSQNILNFSSGDEVKKSLNTPEKVGISLSLNKLQPKYFRRPSAAADLISNNKTLNTDFDDNLNPNAHLLKGNEISSPIKGKNSFQCSSLQIRKKCFHRRDLVLETCGLISVPDPPDLLFLNSHYFTQKLDYNKEINASNLPISPINFNNKQQFTEYLSSSDILPLELQEASEPLEYKFPLVYDMNLKCRKNLLEHRHSLPAQLLAPYEKQSLGQELAPQILITEEGTGNFKQGSILKDANFRLSKSSQDVPTLTSPSPLVNKSQFLLQPSKISPYLSSSTQELSGENELPLTPSIKSSLSDTSLSESHSAKINSQDNLTKSGSRVGNKDEGKKAQFKKELVLVPLGRLARGMQSLGANYLHPKKIKETFRQSSSRKEGDGINQPEGLFAQEELKILEEMKKKSKSLIIEI